MVCRLSLPVARAVEGLVPAVVGVGIAAPVGEAGVDVFDKHVFAGPPPCGGHVDGDLCGVIPVVGTVKHTESFDKLAVVLFRFRQCNRVGGASCDEEC